MPMLNNPYGIFPFQRKDKPSKEQCGALRATAGRNQSEESIRTEDCEGFVFDDVLAGEREGSGEDAGEIGKEQMQQQPGFGSAENEMGFILGPTAGLGGREELIQRIKRENGEKMKWLPLEPVSCSETFSIILCRVMFDFVLDCNCFLPTRSCYMGMCVVLIFASMTATNTKVEK
jgi:hypothetical protein